MIPERSEAYEVSPSIDLAYHLERLQGRVQGGVTQQSLAASLSWEHRSGQGEMTKIVRICRVVRISVRVRKKREPACSGECCTGRARESSGSGELQCIPWLFLSVLTSKLPSEGRNYQRWAGRKRTKTHTRLWSIKVEKPPTTQVVHSERCCLNCGEKSA